MRATWEGRRWEGRRTAILASSVRLSAFETIYREEQRCPISPSAKLSLATNRTAVGECQAQYNMLHIPQRTTAPDLRPLIFAFACETAHNLAFYRLIPLYMLQNPQLSPC